MTPEVILLTTFTRQLLGQRSLGWRSNNSSNNYNNNYNYINYNNRQQLQKSGTYLLYNFSFKLPYRVTMAKESIIAKFE